MSYYNDDENYDIISFLEARKVSVDYEKKNYSVIGLPSNINEEFVGIDPRLPGISFYLNDPITKCKNVQVYGSFNQDVYREFVGLLNSAARYGQYIEVKGRINTAMPSKPIIAEDIGRKPMSRSELESLLYKKDKAEIL